MAGGLIQFLSSPNLARRDAVGEGDFLGGGSAGEGGDGTGGGLGGEVQRPLIGATGVGMRGQGALPFSRVMGVSGLGNGERKQQKQQKQQRGAGCSGEAILVFVVLISGE